MNFDNLKTGKEFIAYFFDDDGGHAGVFKWVVEDESFYVKDEFGDFVQYVHEQEFKHTTIVTE